MKVEVERFYDGDLKVLVRFEPNNNFWKETLTWVPTIKEIELILNTLLGIDVVNRWKRYGRNSRYGEQSEVNWLIEKSPTERFDEAFKMLLIIMTIAFSASIAFYKETMKPKFFSITVEAFVFTIVLWSFSTLYDGKHEYGMKIGAWYFLMLAYGLLFARLQYVVFLLPPFVASFILLVSLALTLPMLEYLKKTISEEDYKFLRTGLPLITVVLIIVDVLYFLGLVTFPLF